MPFPSPVHLETERLVLTMPPPGEAPRVVDYVVRNRAFLKPFEPTRPAEFFTVPFWEERLATNRRELEEDRSMRLVMYSRAALRSGAGSAKASDGEWDPGESQLPGRGGAAPSGRTEPLVIGFVNFNAFQRGPFQACLLGYSLDEHHQGKGVMFEALERAIAHVFGELKLHRIMANYLPDNARSGKLLERLGFVREGYARNYVHIDGRWRDHVLTSLVSPAAHDPPAR
jgi:ribosomal-protein-alanine N-acetyltransferase